MSLLKVEHDVIDLTQSSDDDAEANETVVIDSSDDDSEVNIEPLPTVDRLLAHLTDRERAGICKTIPVCNGTPSDTACVSLQQQNFCMLHASSNALGEDLGSPETTLRGAYALLSEHDKKSWHYLLNHTGNFEPYFFGRYLRTIGYHLTRATNNGALPTVNSRQSFLKAVKDSSAALLVARGHAQAARLVHGRWLLIDSMRGGHASWLDAESDWTHFFRRRAQAVYTISKAPTA